MTRQSRRTDQGGGFRRRLRFEPLEDRRLLSVIVDLVSQSVTGEAAGSSTNYDPDEMIHAVSANGRYVAFLSSAMNLVSGLAIDPGFDNVYRYDRTTGEVELVSMNIEGTGGANHVSYQPVISADGGVVAFTSFATNLHEAASNVSPEIFARNLDTDTTYLVSINSSGDGDGNGQSWFPTISDDGTVVAFKSSSSNLHPLDTDPYWDIFARDLSAGVTHIATINAAGTGTGNEGYFGLTNPVISGDGSVVAFASEATNLHPLDTDSELDVFARNLATGLTHLVSINAAGTASGSGRSGAPAVSADGNMIAFSSSASDLDPIDQDPGNTERDTDVFVRNLNASSTQLVSINAASNDSGNGESSNPVISANGKVVAFESGASNLVSPSEEETGHEIFARDLVTGSMYCVTKNQFEPGNIGGEGNFDPLIGADGRIVVFESEDIGLYPSDTTDDKEVIAHDLLTGTNYLVSVSLSGSGNGNGDSIGPAISADGHTIAFASKASDLVDNDNNSLEDVFVASLDWNPPRLPGDYNQNGSVDAADYVVWRRTIGNEVANYTEADGDGDGIVGQGDHGVWAAHFGETILQEANGRTDVVGGGSQVVESHPPSEVQSAAGEPIVVKMRIPHDPESSLTRMWRPQPPPTVDASLRPVDGSKLAHRNVALMAWLAETRSLEEAERETADGGAEDASNARVRFQALEHVAAGVGDELALGGLLSGRASRLTALR